MEKLKLPEKIKNMMSWVSDQCDVCSFGLMVIKGRAVCPRCELQKEHQQLQQQIQKEYEAELAARQRNILYRQSVILDETLLDARFINYKTEHPEEIENKRVVLECFDRFRDGQTFNLVLQGKQGTGKSHLTYATLSALNDLGSYSCLFISVDEMLRMIRDSFNNKESKYTESYFVQLLSSVDFLGLDDLGAETGSMESNKSASDFVQRVLYGVANARQKKSTILTTNLSSDKLFQMYDRKLVSRLMKSPKVVVFKDSKDKRITGLPF